MAKIGTFAEILAREPMFSLKHFPLNVLTEKYHPCPGKILYVEKNDLKLTKIAF